MKPWHAVVAVVVLLACLPAAGCRCAAQLDALEREMRFQEEKIYLLQDYVRQYNSQLSECSGENARLRKDLGREPDADAGTPVKIEMPPGVEIPKVDPGTPVEKRRDDTQPPKLLPSQHGAPLKDAARTSLLDPKATGGYDADGRPGDDGVLLVFRQRQETGRPVPAAGRLSVAVIDPSGRSEAEARVARWDLSLDEVAAGQNAGEAAAMQIELPWPDRPPARGNLRLFVRLATPQGATLEAEHPIRVNLPHTQTTRHPTWSPHRQ